MAITQSQRRQLRKLAHHLKPVVTVGAAGLRETVLNEIDIALAHHELIKIRIHAADKAERQNMIDTIGKETEADWVLSIGHIAAFYRPAEKPKLVLS
ncbi:MAG TPA: ribosome assembly RNA-binding protein YhbY [Chromatiales bacterium]|nr:ribosome assembly RNA-binding protein YhbY [Chromatiales bacterium]